MDIFEMFFGGSGGRRQQSQGPRKGRSTKHQLKVGAAVSTARETRDVSPVHSFTA